jgi:hypothetical protein
MKRIATMGNTVVPALLELEKLGFTVKTGKDSYQCRATRNDEEYSADDPVTVLGLVKLIESRGWNWHASDEEIDATLRRYPLL